MKDVDRIPALADQGDPPEPGNEPDGDGDYPWDSAA
jgi:hypothetical protein